MAEHQDVKVFISWSGDLARIVADALRGWLPLFFDRVAPWMSDIDIAAGQRGLAQIEASLEGTTFGIVVVTAQNQASPWLNFEAGAMSKVVEADVDQRVVPLLVDLDAPTELEGPLAQFQAKVLTESGMRDVVLSLAQRAGVSPTTAVDRFETYWPKLAEPVFNARTTTELENEIMSPKRSIDSKLDEMLGYLREIRSADQRQRKPLGIFTGVPLDAPNIDIARMQALSDLLENAGIQDVISFTLTPDGTLRLGVVGLLQDSAIKHLEKRAMNIMTVPVSLSQTPF